MSETSEPRSLGERRQSWLRQARLYLVCDTRNNDSELTEILRPALQAGVAIAQLRDKDASGSGLVRAARTFRRLCDAYDALFIVNDRPDLALACGADGLHIGQDDISPLDARRVIGDDLLLGLSTHSEDQFEAALELEICDYLSVGPVFATPTKPTYEPVGLDLIKSAAERVDRPFFAIGGIDTDNIGDVISAGASRVAVVRAIVDAEDPSASAKKLKRAVEIAEDKVSLRGHPVPDGL